MNLSDADRLTINDTVGNLDQRELKVERDIASKIKALGDALENFKEVNNLSLVNKITIAINLFNLKKKYSIQTFFFETLS